MPSTTPGEDPKTPPRQSQRRPIPVVGSGDPSDDPTPVRPPLPGAGDERDKPTPPPAPRPPLPGPGDDADKPSVKPAVPIVSKNTGETDRSAEGPPKPPPPPSPASPQAVAASAAIRTAERELKAEITGRIDSQARREQAIRRDQEKRAADAIGNIANRFATRYFKSPSVNRELREIERKLRNGEPLSEREASTVFGLSGDPAFGLNSLSHISWVPERKSSDLEIKEMRLGGRTAVAIARSGTATLARVSLSSNLQRQITKAARAGEQSAIRRAAASRATGSTLKGSTGKPLIRAQAQARSARVRLKQAQAELQEARAKGIANSSQLTAVIQASKALVNAEAQVTAQAVRQTVTVAPNALSGVKPGQSVFVTVQPSATPTSTPAITITKPAPGGKTVSTRVPKPTPKTGTRTRVEQKTGPAPGPKPRFKPGPKPVATPKAQVAKITTPTRTATARTTRTPLRTPGARPSTPSRPTRPTRGGGPVPPPVSFGDRPSGSSRSGSRQPVVLNYRQGALYKRVNLVTGTIRSSRTVPPGGVRAGTTPRQTLKPVKFGKKTRRRSFDTGRFVATVSGDRVTFAEDKGQSAIRERLTP